MDLREIRYFRTIAEYGNFSKAAAHLRIAQPALSRAIQKLEHDLKIELFCRSSRGVTLTLAGSMLLDRTGGLEKEVDQIRRSMAQFAEGVTGQVRVGMQTPFSIVIAPRLVRAYGERHPQVQLKILEAGSGDITDRLLDQQLDLAVVDPPAHDHADLLTIPLWSEQLFLVGRSEGIGGVPFPEGPITGEVLERIPLVMSSDRHALRRLIDAAFLREHRKLVPVIEAEGPLTIMSLVRAGLGYSLLPRMALCASGAKAELRTAPIVPTLLRTVGIVVRRASRSERAVSSLIDLISNFMQQIAADDDVGGVSLYR